MKKILLVLVSLCISVCSYALSTWDGVSTSTTWYTQGSGAVYHIKTAADLAGLSKCFSQGYYMYGDFEGRTIYLDDDIDLAGYEWTPIGTLDAQNYYYAFAGTFDGQGHTITGLKITQTNLNEYIRVAGLFGYAPVSSFSVRNLKVEGSISLSNICTNSYASLYVGGIVGEAYSECGLTNCESNVDINIIQTAGTSINVNCGGIVGGLYDSGNSSLLTQSYSKGNINVSLNNSNRAYVGGIAGIVGASNAILDQVASEANIVIESGDLTGIGGIVGQISLDCIKNALFSGSILLQYPSYGLVGGIAGMNVEAVTYENCLVTGNISKYYGTGWLSAICGTTGSGEIVTNCYYKSDLPNNSSYGIPISDVDLKSGYALNGFDTDIWVFPVGMYPYLGFTKPMYLLNLALEGGYVGIKLNEGASQKFVLSQDSDAELYQVLWNGEDITDLVDTTGNLTTPEIYENSVLTVVYRSSGVKENRIHEKITTFNIYGSTLTIKNPYGIQNLQIYNKAGSLIYEGTNIGLNMTIEDLMHDVYIVRVNSESFKVII